MHPLLEGLIRLINYMFLYRPLLLLLLRHGYAEGIA